MPNPNEHDQPAEGGEDPIDHTLKNNRKRQKTEKKRKYSHLRPLRTQTANARAEG